MRGNDMADRPIPQPNCPEAIRVNGHIPMAHVVDVDRSIEFYTLLGFSCGSRFSNEQGVTYFAALNADRANLMVVRADAPIDPRQQAIIFYMYAPNVAELRTHLLKHGLADGGLPPSERDAIAGAQCLTDRPTVFTPTFPFYMPAGEIRVHDPDGYCILVGQLGEK